jgi:hypothetical protein
MMVTSLMLTTSCTFSFKSESHMESADSLANDSLFTEQAFSDDPDMIADGVDVAPDDQWTEEAVARQIKKIYAEVSKAFASSQGGLENSAELDSRFCTEDFNDLQRQIRIINAKKKSDKRFERDDIRWTYGMDVPVTPQNIQVELLTGNTAEATFELHSGEQWLQTKITLDWEDNQWKIRSWNEVGDNSSDLFDEMYKYVEANS